MTSEFYLLACNTSFKEDIEMMPTKVSGVKVDLSIFNGMCAVLHFAYLANAIYDESRFASSSSFMQLDNALLCDQSPLVQLYQCF